MVWDFRFKDSLSKLSWPEVNRLYHEECGKVLSVIDLILTLPASSAENERGFSSMKLLKSNRRTKMSGGTLDKLMSIQMCTTTVDQFDPEPAIVEWMKAGSRPRRPSFMDRQIPKRRRLAVNVAHEEADPTDEDDETENCVIFEGDAFSQDLPNECQEDSDSDEGFQDDDEFEAEMSEEEIFSKLMTLVWTCFPFVYIPMYIPMNTAHQYK